MIHFNVVLTVSTLTTYLRVCAKLLELHFNISLFSNRGEKVLKKAHNYGTDLGQICRIFSPQLENNDILKCSSHSFAHTLRYVVNVENCQNYIEMYHCPPIAARRSQIALKLG